MATNAISRSSDGIHVHAKLDDYGADGVFLHDGTVVRGTLGSCPKNLFAFKVWSQIQDDNLTLVQRKKKWNQLHPDKKV